MMVDQGDLDIISDVGTDRRARDGVVDKEHRSSQKTVRAEGWIRAWRTPWAQVEGVLDIGSRDDGCHEMMKEDKRKHYAYNNAARKGALGHHGGLKSMDLNYVVWM
jgi:hypothetical protein